MSFELTAYIEFLETIPDAAMVVSATGKIVHANSQLEQLFGYAAGALTHQSLHCLVPTTQRTAHQQHTDRYLQNPHTRPMGSDLQLNGQRADGSEFAADVMLKPVNIAGAVHTLCVVRDISERRQYEAALKDAIAREHKLARTDYLTGAANTRYFYDLLQQEIDRSQRYQHPFTVAYIDLDNFKVVNDLLGHSIGDQVLRTVVHHTQCHLRKTDCVARLGGDEFILLLTETDQAAARTIIDKIQHGLLSAMHAAQWPITFSMGVLTCLQAPASVDELIKHSDRLMYSVKNSGKNAVEYATYGSAE